MPERTYKNMGYRNATGFLIPCCDEAGVKVFLWGSAAHAQAAKCEPNKFVIPENYMNNVRITEADLSYVRAFRLSVQ